MDLVWASIYGLIELDLWRGRFNIRSLSIFYLSFGVSFAIRQASINRETERKPETRSVTLAHPSYLMDGHAPRKLTTRLYECTYPLYNMCYDFLRQVTSGTPYGLPRAALQMVQQISGHICDTIRVLNVPVRKVLQMAQTTQQLAGIVSILVYKKPLWTHGVNSYVPAHIPLMLICKLTGLLYK